MYKNEKQTVGEEKGDWLIEIWNNKKIIIALTTYSYRIYTLLQTLLPNQPIQSSN
jgi:hypothetical protein